MRLWCADGKPTGQEALHLLLGEEARPQLILRNIPGCLAKNSPQRSWGKLAVERNHQCLALPHGTRAPKFQVAAGLSNSGKPEVGQDRCDGVA